MKTIVKLFLPIFKLNFPEIVDIALPAEGVFHNLVWSGVAQATRVSVSATRRNSFVLPDVSGVTPDTAGETPALPHKIMHGLWGMGQMKNMADKSPRPRNASQQKASSESRTTSEEGRH